MWTRQFNSTEVATPDVAVDSSGIYAASDDDALRKYDLNGNLLWKRDFGACVAIGSGAVYVSDGWEWIRKYDGSGNELWTRELDAEGWEYDPYGPRAMCTYSGALYVTGELYGGSSGDHGGGFLRKYDTDGNEQWTSELEFDGLEFPLDVSADSSGVYVVGSMSDWYLDKWDAFLCKFDEHGSQVWIKSITVSGGRAEAISIGSGGIYVADSGGFLCRYSSGGNRIWTQPLVSSDWLSATSVCFHDGAVYVAGSVSGALPGQASQGGSDAFVSRYDTAGNRVWINQFGTNADDAVAAVSASFNGIYVGGSTGGAMPNSQGTGSAFLSRLTVSQYPDRPVNMSPTDGATGISLTPILQGSSFSDVDGDSHAASRWQIRSTTGDYDSPVWDSGSSAAATSITVPAGRLSNGTLYYWRVGYQDSRGLWSSYSKETSFTTIEDAAVAPVVATVAASGIGSTSATLSLSLSSLGSAPSVQVSFEWGPGTAYGNTTTPQTMNGQGSFTYPLTGLSPATTYYFRAKAEGEGISYGSDMSFTTSSTPVNPPAVTTNPATGVGMDVSTLNGTLTGLGSASSVQVSFEWGLTASYGNSTPLGAMTGTDSFSANLSGLTAGATYHYRAKAVGDDTAYGADMTFTTSATPTTPPVVATGDADTVTASSARLNGDLVSLGTAASATVSFVWGTTQGGPYTNETAGAAQTAAGAFGFDLSGLASGTTFYYQAKAVGNGTSYGGEKSYTTTASSSGLPSIGSLVADNGRPGDELTVTITGSNLSGATALSLGAGITINEFRVVSDTEITAKIAIASGVDAGDRDVMVTTPQGTGTASGAFTVNDVGGRVRLWVYLVAAVGGVAVLGLLASLGVWLLRRPAKPAP